MHDSTPGGAREALVRTPFWRRSTITFTHVVPADRVVSASRVLAVFALIVDAKDERAKAFYLHFGFEPFASAPLRLCLPARTLEALADVTR